MFRVLLTLALLVFVLIGAVVAYVKGHTEGARFLVQAFSGVSVVLAVLVALYRDLLTNIADGIRLRIELPEQTDNFENRKATPEGVVRKQCHHLRVVNERPHRPVNNCRVWLVRILDEISEGRFEEKFKFAVPRLMQWAPFEYSPDVRNFSHDQVFDFGESIVDLGGFKVSYFRQQGGAFKGNCEPGKCRRYVFKITADNYIRSKPFTVEVSVLPIDTAAVGNERTRIKVIS
jgi:hypothetical protein